MDIIYQNFIGSYFFFLVICEWSNNFFWWTNVPESSGKKTEKIEEKKSHEQNVLSGQLELTQEICRFLFGLYGGNSVGMRECRMKERCICPFVSVLVARKINWIYHNYQISGYFLAKKKFRKFSDLITTNIFLFSSSVRLGNQLS